MYGLADRIARSAIHQNHPTPVVELAPRGTIMVVDRDPAMLAMVRSSLEGSCHIVVARDAGEALSQTRLVTPRARAAIRRRSDGPTGCDGSMVNDRQVVAAQRRQPACQQVETTGVG